MRSDQEVKISGDKDSAQQNSFFFPWNLLKVSSISAVIVTNLIKDLLK
jgi:hypothetical protein